MIKKESRSCDDIVFLSKITGNPMNWKANTGLDESDFYPGTSIYLHCDTKSRILNAQQRQ